MQATVHALVVDSVPLAMHQVFLTLVEVTQVESIGSSEDIEDFATQQASPEDL
jgi:hypothetical protein